MHHKKTNRKPKSQYWYTVTAFLSTVSTAVSRHSAVRCDRRLRGVCRLPSADCSVRAEVCGLRICGRRSAVIIVNWIRGLTATVRSAITATAELLVIFGFRRHLGLYCSIHVLCLHSTQQSFELKTTNMLILEFRHIFTTELDKSAICQSGCLTTT